MKLSCLPVSLYADFRRGALSLETWFQWARALGLDGADLSVAHLRSYEPGYLHQLRDRARAQGLEIAMLVAYSDFTLPTAAQRERHCTLLERQIEAAACLNAPYIRLTAGQAWPGVNPRQGLRWAADGLQRAADWAAARGVQALYENHTRGSVWAWNDFSQAADRYLALVEATRDSALGLLFDTANNLALYDDPLSVLRQVAARVTAVHWADVKEPGSFQPVVIGTGASPHREIAACLAAAGFDGWISVEEASGTGRAGLRQGRIHADAAWQAAGGAPRSRAARPASAISPAP